MRIKQLIQETPSQEQLDELDMTGLAKGAGTALGKTAQGLGAVAGGVKGAWDAAKSGFQAGKNFVSGKGGATQQAPAGSGQQEPAQTSAPTQAPAQAQSDVNPQDIQSQIAQKKQEISALQKQLSAAKAQPAQGGQQQATGGAGAFGQMANAITGGGQAEPAQPNTMANAPVSKTNTAKPGNPNAEPAAAPAATTPPATAPAATTTPPATGTAPLTAQQQAAKKAELLGKRAAGKTTASQTGGGFNQYVQGGGGSTLAGADKQGNPVFKQNVKRETYEFESKFLGRMI
jgi:hypothetical protein